MSLPAAEEHQLQKMREIVFTKHYTVKIQNKLNFKIENL